jgi:predicted ATPase
MTFPLGKNNCRWMGEIIVVDHCLIYRLIKAGQGYQEADVHTYELKYKDQILRSLRKRANGLGFDLVELPQAA